MIAIQPKVWTKGLNVSKILYDRIISAESIRFCELYEEGWYWDGDPGYHLDQERRKLRRQLEDRIRKDPMAFANAALAVFGDDPKS